MIDINHIISYHIMHSIIILLLLHFIYGHNIQCGYEADAYDKNFNMTGYNFCKDYYDCLKSYVTLMNNSNTIYICYILFDDYCFDPIIRIDGNYTSFGLDMNNKIINETIVHSSSFSISFYVQCLQLINNYITSFCIKNDDINMSKYNMQNILI